jgi:alkylated DNA repair protein (DNA oxidative demethylase)
MSEDLAAASVVGSISIAPQHAMVSQVREVIRASPLVRPKTPNGLDVRVRVTAAGSLGWVGDGVYRYSETDSRGLPWPELPAAWASLATEFAGPQPWDSAIVNWYDPDASLGWHRDLSEADHSFPIVTFSLGDVGAWAVRLDIDTPIHRARLESGAVTVLEGRTRTALHTVERIIPAPMFSPLRCGGRVSVTIRVAGGQP